MVIVHARGDGGHGSFMCGVTTVSSWCHHGVSWCCCHVASFIWLACHPVGDVAPAFGCEKRMENSRLLVRAVGWQEAFNF